MLCMLLYVSIIFYIYSRKLKKTENYKAKSCYYQKMAFFEDARSPLGKKNSLEK